MQAIKNVFKHEEEGRSPSGHFSSSADDDANVAHKHHQHATHERERSSSEPIATIAGVGGGSHTPTHHYDTPTTAPIGTDLTSTSRATGDTTASGTTSGIGTFVQSAVPPSTTADQDTSGHAYHSHAILDKEGAKRATHDHKQLAPVVHEKHHVEEHEDAVRQREVERHIHHVQTHVQPVKDIQHKPEHHHERVLPTTEVIEKHVSTQADREALERQLATERDTHEELPKERVVVDKGEVVHERELHHVHHLVRPVIEREIIEHETIHTTIPSHHVVEESPIVHEKVVHAPIAVEDFIKGGGDLDSKLTLAQAGVLVEGQECSRTVQGPAEEMLEKLHLSSSSSPSTSSAAKGENVQPLQHQHQHHKEHGSHSRTTTTSSRSHRT